MDYLTVKQTAVMLKIHPLTVRRYIREGKLEAVRIAGNIRIKEEDLKKLIETFVPQSRPLEKGKILAKKSTFSVRDPFFRLKGKAISYIKK